MQSRSGEQGRGGTQGEPGAIGARRLQAPWHNRILQYFRAVRRAIAEQHRRCVSSATAQRREKLFLDTRSIAAELQGRGLYPSVNKIVERLPEGSCSEWKTITLAVCEAQKTLGILK